MIGKNEVTRGFNFSISHELFSSIMEKALGMDEGTLDIKHVTCEHWRFAVEMSGTSTDESFPVVNAGERYPNLTPIVMYVPAGDEGKHEIQFMGFERFKER